MKRNTMSYKVKQFLMFAGVAAVLFCAVVVIPFVYGIYLTLTSWDGIAKTKPFVGFANYAEAFKDVAYWQALGRTAIYSIFAVVLINVVAFALAYLVTSGIKGQNFFRAGFFVPNLIGGIVLGYVWKFVFNRAFVALGSAITKGTVPSLLSTTSGAMFCLVLVSVWQFAGYMMLIYVAGFMSVSDALKEAAMIDGCNPLQTYTKVLLPILRPTIISTAILELMWVWNDYLLPQLVLDTNKYNTIPMVIQRFRGSYGHVAMGAMMASIMIDIIPIVIVYLICQKYIIKGVVSGAVKG